jgi:NAD-dependent dihydropyrimidine dehydrogenase PreA subunit
MFSRLKELFSGNGEHKVFVPDGARLGLLQVTADASRCVQCGICGYNCPVGIEVREYARRGQNVTDCRCIACGACVEKCPRGTLRWGPAILVRDDNKLEVDPDALPEMLRLLPIQVDT